MKKIPFILLILSTFFCFSQGWNQVSNFTGDGRHHPITFGNDNYGFVISGSYLDDFYRYDSFLL